MLDAAACCQTRLKGKSVAALSVLAKLQCCSSRPVHGCVLAPPRRRRTELWRPALLIPLLVTSLPKSIMGTQTFHIVSLARTCSASRAL
jgi:hypothetical protein